MTPAQARQSNGEVPAAGPGPTPLLRCRCGAAWLDDDEGRRAHDVVFGHQPETREAPPRTSAESTERETTP